MPESVRRYLMSCQPEDRQKAQDACIAMRNTIHPGCEPREDGRGTNCTAECIAISLTMAATGQAETMQMAFRLHDVLLSWMKMLEDMSAEEVATIGETK